MSSAEHRTRKPPPIPPLRNGDNLTVAEFERRYENMPELKKAELIDGVVYIPSDFFDERLDPSIPPLQNGDNLTVAEFERRYENMPHVKKAELIDGVVYMSSPVTVDHGSPHGDLITWMGTYSAHTKGTQFVDNTTLKLKNGVNQPQADGALRILPAFGGRSSTEKRYIVGGVELAAEVSFSSVTYDLHQKLHVYEKNGIQEYVVWRVEDEAIDWFTLKAGKYERLARGKAGICKSKVFPGLWLDTKAMIAGNLLKVLATLQLGIAAPAHRRFVAKLKSRQQ